MNKHKDKLAAFSETGADIHLVVDWDIVKTKEGDYEMMVLAACGKLFTTIHMMTLPHNQISCQRCRSVSKKYQHGIGQVDNG